MKHGNEYRVQGYFVALMSILILGGILIITGLFKSIADEFPLSAQPWYLRFILCYGLLLILLPVLWASVTIQLENHKSIRFHQIDTFISGMLLLIGLTSLFIHCALIIMYPEYATPMQPW
jgi:hypothetical protein